MPTVKGTFCSLTSYKTWTYLYPWV